MDDAEKLVIEGTIEMINKQLGDYRRDGHLVNIGPMTSCINEVGDSKRVWYGAAIKITKGYYVEKNR